MTALQTFMDCKQMSREQQPFCAMMYTKQEPFSEHYLLNVEPLFKALLRLGAGFLVRQWIHRSNKKKMQDIG